MKRIIFVISLILFSVSVFAELGPQLPDYKADKVSSNTWVIHGPKGFPSPENYGFMNNPAFIKTSAGIVIVDPGGSLQIGEMVLKQAAKISKDPVVAVFNTHVHGDHWLGNHAIRNQFPKAVIYGHKRMIAEVNEGAGETWVNSMLSMTKGKTAGTEIVKPTNVVNNADKIKIGDTHFVILYEAHAHSDTDIMIRVVEEDIVFLGDNAMYGRFGQMRHGTFKGNIKALDIALQQPEKIFVPGHGPTGDKSVPEAFRTYLDIINGTVTRLYKDDMELAEMKPIVKKALDKYSTWNAFDTETDKHIAQAFLEVEEELF